MGNVSLKVLEKSLNFLFKKARAQKTLQVHIMNQSEMFHVSKVLGAKKVSFTACLLGKQQLAHTGLEFFLMSGIDYSSSVI